MPSHARARLGPLALLAALALSIAACSASGAGSPAASAQAPTPAPASAAASPAAGGPAIAIAGFAFDPATLSVGTETTVTWTNNDTAAHTVTADDGSFDSKTIAPGATFTHSFGREGTYAYHCAIHSSMTATITVVY
jgi:plastocyanin